MNFARPLKVLLLCSLVIAAACGLHDSRSTNNANSASSSTATPAAEADPLDAMVNAINAQFQAKSFRARAEASFDGKNSTQTIEYVGPDRIHMRGEMGEIISIGSDTYQKLPTGQWIKVPVNVNEFLASFRDPKLVDELRGNTEVKFLGTDTIEGMPVKVYQYIVKNALGTNTTTTSKAWISTADNLPRKIESEGQIEGKISKTLVTYYDYNADIKIEPPM